MNITAKYTNSSSNTAKIERATTVVLLDVIRRKIGANVMDSSIRALGELLAVKTSSDTKPLQN